MKFDLTKIDTKTTQGNYKMKYALYREEKGFKKDWDFEDLSEAIKSGKVVGRTNNEYSNICFAGVRYMTTKNDNRILFKADFRHVPKKENHLSLTERKRWTMLCRHHGLMPRYIGKHYYETGNFIMRFDDLTATKIYVALIAARVPQECPETARATIYFRSRGLNFFLALLAAGRCTWSVGGHTFFSQIKQYAVNNDPHRVKVKPQDALALKAYLTDGHKTDGESLVKLATENNIRYPLFKLQTTLVKKVRDIGWKDGEKETTIPELFNKRYQDVLRKPVHETLNYLKGK